MKYGFIALLFSLLISLAACSSDPSKATAGSATKPTLSEEEAKKGVECTYEIPVGSNIRKKKCTTAEEREAQRRQYELLPSAPAANSAR